MYQGLTSLKLQSQNLTLPIKLHRNPLYLIHLIMYLAVEERRYQEALIKRRMTI
jgi:hypothetical protein